MSKKMIVKKLEAVENGKTFKVGSAEFIKFFDKDGVTAVVTKDTVCNSVFGENNNFAESEILKRLNEKFLPEIIKVVGEENVCEFKTDLTTLDGLKTYGTVTFKVSLPTFDFYRNNVEIFDKYKIDDWWWLATPDSASPHREKCPWVVCVAPPGYVDDDGYGSNCGVRPFLNFVSSISVSCEE